MGKRIHAFSLSREGDWTCAPLIGPKGWECSTVREYGEGFSFTVLGYGHKGRGALGGETRIWSEDR